MNNEQIANFLLELRTKKGLSQSDLADIIGVSNKTISKWETGVSLPDAFYLPLLANCYDITVDEILLGRLHQLSDKFKVNPYLITLSLIAIFISTLSHFVTLIFFLTNNEFLFHLGLTTSFITALGSIIISFICVRNSKNYVRVFYLIFFLVSTLNLFSYLFSILVMIK